MSLIETIGLAMRRSVMDLFAASLIQRGLQYERSASMKKENGLPKIEGADRALEWLVEMLERGKVERFAVFATLTPDIARLLLDHNATNRKLKDVESMARDIAAGRFATNGESIVVSRCGNLNDGQHRCAAVIMANRAIETVFVFGVERDTRTTLDQGKARTAGDYLEMDGVGSGNLLAAVGKKAMTIQKHGKIITGPSYTPTKSEQREFVLAHEAELRHSANIGQSTGYRVVGSPSTLGAAHFLFSRVDVGIADKFMKALITGTNLENGSPIAAARNKLVGPIRLNENEKLKAMIMAWNAWRRGEKRSKLYHEVKNGDPLPEVK